MATNKADGAACRYRRVEGRTIYGRTLTTSRVGNEAEHGSVTKVAGDVL